MKIQLKTKDNSDYVIDVVDFEDDGDFIEITHGCSGSFKVWKSDLKKVIKLLTEEE